MEAEKHASGGIRTQGRIVMATVKGDVHDIGKNIVGVVLGCNNYEVIDLGVMVPCEKILRAARDRKADMIGLSGLITPSLDEMVHVAREMSREGFELPLLIGGATTSRVHTAVKIAPAYPHPVVHVADASRAVGVAAALVSDALKDQFVGKIRQEQEAARVAHKGRKPQRAFLRLEEARQNRTPIGWSKDDIARPSFIGIRTLSDFPLEQIVSLIDWSPLFHAWELRGVYPQILNDSVVGDRARELLADAKGLLDRIVDERLLTARAVYGFLPASAVGDDIEVYSDESRSGLLTTFHMLRQQTEKQEGQFNRCLADFIAPKSSGISDYLGAFAVTTGFGVEALCEKFERDHDDYNAIMAKALADRLAEAFAELLHKRVREEWGYGLQENLTTEDLIRERYRGIRPAPGYPACPDHSEKRLLFNLLHVEERTGIRLTENFAMMPASSVSGFYFAHPKAGYFAVGKVARDQALDYQRRKGVELSAIEHWLAPNLAYDPAESQELPAEEGVEK
jgi:5-methyltetrahydrofolate--homocysteine methyltransferase